MQRAYGDDTNISDWLVFYNFLRKQRLRPSVTVLYTLAGARYQKNCPGWLRTTLRPEEIRHHLQQMVEGHVNDSFLSIRDKLLTPREHDVLQRLCYGKILPTSAEYSVSIRKRSAHIRPVPYVSPEYQACQYRDTFVTRSAVKAGDSL
jgi:hypothetical protein